MEISNAAKRSSWLMMVCPEIREVSGFFRTDRRQFPSIIQSREEAIFGGRLAAGLSQQTSEDN